MAVQLSDAKTFDCYFHYGNAALLALVADFQAKRGKFAIQGYPDKLGLLLHGPPGTGACPNSCSITVNHSVNCRWRTVCGDSIRCCFCKRMLLVLDDCTLYAAKLQDAFLC